MNRAELVNGWHDWRTMMRRLIRWRGFACFLGRYEWYRRLHGGWWALVYIDSPICSDMWLQMPNEWVFNQYYREPLWRGTPTFEFYG